MENGTLSADLSLCEYEVIFKNDSFVLWSYQGDNVSQGEMCVEYHKEKDMERNFLVHFMIRSLFQLSIGWKIKKSESSWTESYGTKHILKN